MNSSYREIRRNIILIHADLRSKNRSDEERAELVEALERLQAESERADTLTISQEEIESRGKIVASKKGLLDVFTGLWISVFPYTREKVLTQNGYLKFFHAFRVAILGFHDYQVFKPSLLADWKNDSLVFGELNKERFFDLLFELLEMWMEIIHQDHHAALAWLLLDSLVDISTDPLKLRKRGDIKSLTDANETKMYPSFAANSETPRVTLHLTKGNIERVSDVQKRINGREMSVRITEIEDSMLVEVADRFKIDDNIDSCSDSDDENISHQSSVRNVNMTSIEVTAISSRREGTDADSVTSYHSARSSSSAASSGSPSIKSANGFPDFPDDLNLHSLSAAESTTDYQSTLGINSESSPDMDLTDYTLHDYMSACGLSVSALSTLTGQREVTEDSLADSPAKHSFFLPHTTNSIYQHLRKYKDPELSRRPLLLPRNDSIFSRYQDWRDQQRPGNQQQPVVMQPRKVELVGDKRAASNIQSQLPSVRNDLRGGSWCAGRQGRLQKMPLRNVVLPDEAETLVHSQMLHSSDPPLYQHIDFLQNFNNQPDAVFDQMSAEEKFLHQQIRLGLSTESVVGNESQTLTGGQPLCQDSYSLSMNSNINLQSKRETPAGSTASQAPSLNTKFQSSEWNTAFKESGSDRKSLSDRNLSSGHSGRTTPSGLGPYRSLSPITVKINTSASVGRVAPAATRPTTGERFISSQTSNGEELPAYLTENIPTPINSSRGSINMLTKQKSVSKLIKDSRNVYKGSVVSSPHSMAHLMIPVPGQGRDLTSSPNNSFTDLYSQLSAATAGTNSTPVVGEVLTKESQLIIDLGSTLGQDLMPQVQESTVSDTDSTGTHNSRSPTGGREDSPPQGETRMVGNSVIQWYSNFAETVGKDAILNALGDRLGTSSVQMAQPPMDPAAMQKKLNVKISVELNRSPSTNSEGWAAMLPKTPSRPISPVHQDNDTVYQSRPSSYESKSDSNRENTGHDQERMQTSNLRSLSRDRDSPQSFLPSLNIKPIRVASVKRTPTAQSQNPLQNQIQDQGQSRGTPKLQSLSYCNASMDDATLEEPSVIPSQAFQPALALEHQIGGSSFLTNTASLSYCDFGKRDGKSRIVMQQPMAFPIRSTPSGDYDHDTVCIVGSNVSMFKLSQSHVNSSFARSSMELDPRSDSMLSHPSDPIPWVPRGHLRSIDAGDSKSNLVNAWRQKNEAQKHVHTDSTMIAGKIRSQPSIRIAFEEFALSTRSGG